MTLHTVYTTHYAQRVIHRCKLRFGNRRHPKYKINTQLARVLQRKGDHKLIKLGFQGNAIKSAPPYNVDQQPLVKRYILVCLCIKDTTKFIGVQESYWVQKKLHDHLIAGMVANMMVEFSMYWTPMLA